jgi:hypothetical protein
MLRNADQIGSGNSYCTQLDLAMAKDPFSLFYSLSAFWPMLGKH